MMPSTPVDPAETYTVVLGEYIHDRNEEALYRASILSQAFVEQGLGPDDIIAVHFDALEEVLTDATVRERARAIADAHQFLLEVMIAYGVRFREYLELKVRESIRDAETRANAERERALLAQQAERHKSEILAIIAHELRTPITAAKGNIDIAVRSIRQGQMDRIGAFLGTAQEALDRLSRLTADLMEASRGEPQHYELAPQDLLTQVDQVCTWVRAAAAAKGIQLDVEREADTIPVEGNADALLSVFGNLLSNAVSYTSPGGKVTVRSRVEGERAVIEIQDTGIGMDGDILSNIFTKFYRAPEARTADRRGLGLGLALANEIVQAHHGHIEVESEAGKGSLFRVVLPLHRASKEEGGISVQSA